MENFAVKIILDVAFLLMDSKLAKKLVPTKTKPRGIINNGTSCYFNSLMQCLFDLHDFRKAILQLNSELKIEELELLKNFFIEMVNKSIEKPITISGLSEKMHWSLYIEKWVQGDAAELFFHLIGLMERDKNLVI